MNDSNDSIFAEFPPDEQERRRKINALMEDWANELARVRVDPGDGESAGSECFCADGFYPYYYGQKRRILFIGREARGIAECDYIEILLESYRKNYVHEATLDQHLFHKRLLQLAWGILQGGKVSYQEVPLASELGRTFGTPEGISFAFMELSKYANQGGTSARRNPALMAAFLKDSRLEKRNFVREELALLAPDVVITMNLWRMGVDRALVDLALGKVTGDRKLGYPLPKSSGFIEINGKQTPLLNLYHFSSRYNTEEYFYKPAMRLITDPGGGMNEEPRLRIKA